MTYWKQAHQNAHRWCFSSSDIRPPLTLKQHVEFGRDFQLPVMVVGGQGQVVIFSLEGVLIGLKRNLEKDWIHEIYGPDRKNMVGAGKTAIGLTQSGLLVSRGHCVTSHDIENGEIRWTNRESAFEYLGYGNEILSIQKRYICAGSTEGIIRKIDIESGKTLNTMRLGWPILSSGEYVSAHKNSNDGKSVFSVVDTKSWTKGNDFEWPFQGAVLSKLLNIGSRFYWADVQGLVSVNFTSGKVMWQHKYAGNQKDPIDRYSIICTDGKVIYSKREKWLVAYDARSGDILWKSKRSKSRVYQSNHNLIVSSSFLYCFRADNKLEIFDKIDGKAIWLSKKLPIDRPSFFPAVIGKDYCVCGCHSLCFLEGQ